MMFMLIFWFFFFVKQLSFWLWLWQLKEYRLDRFLAHFETRIFEKIISSFWRLKYPKFTKKIIAIFFSCLILEIFFLFYFSFFQAVFLTIFFIPFLIIFFQIPTFFWRSIIIEKAKEKREKFKNLLVIGVTGSYAKTSTKEVLKNILSSKFKVLSTPSHQNTDIAIAKLILEKLTEDIEIFIVEMAAYKMGEINSPCRIVKPEIGILTGINEQHMSTFGSQENTIKAKYELIESLPPDGTAFFNAKNKYCLELYKKTGIKKFLYGEDAEFFGEENLSAGIIVAGELGMSEEEIARSVEKIKNKLPGVKQEKGINGLNIIDATYSANPDGVISQLEYLKKLPGKKIIVMPCLIELGKSSKDVHRRIGRKIAEVCDLAIIINLERFKEIKEAAAEKAVFLGNPKDIFEKIKNFCVSGDTVLLESRVPLELIKKLKIKN